MSSLAVLDNFFFSGDDKLVPKIVEHVEEWHIGVDRDVTLLKGALICVRDELEKSVNECSMYMLVLLMVFVRQLPRVPYVCVDCCSLRIIVGGVGAWVGRCYWIRSVQEVWP